MINQSTLIQRVEALFFVSSQSLSIKQLVDYTGSSNEEVAAAIEELNKRYARHDCAMMIVSTGSVMQLTTKPEVADCIQTYLKEEVFGELTKPSLETLAIIAYRGPVTKYEIDTIRGVNSSIMLRTLMVRGLIQEERTKKSKEPAYRLAIEMLRHLGIAGAQDLPRYDDLHANDIIERLMEQHTTPQQSSAPAL